MVLANRAPLPMGGGELSKAIRQRCYLERMREALIRPVLRARDSGRESDGQQLAARQLADLSCSDPGSVSAPRRCDPGDTSPLT